MTQGLPQSYRFGEFTLDCGQRTLQRKGREIFLRPKTFDTLALLVSCHGRLIEKSELLNSVWTDTNVTETVLTHCISEARQALQDDPRNPQYIKTLPRVGYKFITTVEENSRAVQKKTGDEKSAFASAIAVLPFANLSTDPENEHFCDGLVEELIDALTRITALRVVAHSSAFALKNRNLDVREIGRRLNVGSILEGSVRKSGEHLRIAVQLIDATNGYHLWVEEYDRLVDDIFAIQDEISVAIVNKLKVGLASGEEPWTLGHRTNSIEAYNLYLKGRSIWHRRYAGFIEKAIQFYRQALVKDPNYAMAYVGLADAYNTIGAWGFSTPEEVFLESAAMAAKALEIDDKLGEAYASQALTITFYEWDWMAAERTFRKAIEINPGYALAHLWFGHYFSIVGRFEESFAEIKLAQEFDPLSPIVSANLGWTLYLDHRYEEAIQELHNTLELDPHNAVAYFYLGFPYLRLKRYDEAILTLQKAQEITGGMPWAAQLIGCAHGLSGNSSRAKAILQHSEARKRERYVPSSALAFVHLGLGEDDKAMGWLQKGLEERDPCMPWLKVMPDFDGFRSDSVFVDLLRSLGFQ